MTVPVVLLGGFATVNGVLVMAGVTAFVNGAGEPITSLFWRLVLGVVSIMAGLLILATGLERLTSNDTDQISSNSTHGGFHVEGHWADGDGVD